MDLKTEYKLGLLKGVDFLSGFSQDGIESLLADCQEIAFNVGETILTDGEFGETLYIVLAGDLGICKDDIEIAQRGPGDYFGEMALLVPGPRSATVKAKTNSLLLEIDKKQFKSHFGENSHALLAILKTISDRSREDLKALSREYHNLKMERMLAKDARQTLTDTAKVSDAKSEFITNMSEEVIDHLKAILDYAHLLEENPSGNLSAQQKDAVQQILNEGDELLRLTKEAFEFVKVEQGEPAPDVKTTP